MFTGLATVQRQSTTTRRGRLMALASAMALTVVLAGNVAAVPLARDDDRYATLVTPKLERVPGGSLLRFKLATTSGYRILAFG